MMNEFKMECLKKMEEIFGKEHPTYIEFAKAVPSMDDRNAELIVEVHSRFSR